MYNYSITHKTNKRKWIEYYSNRIEKQYLSLIFLEPFFIVLNSLKEQKCT